MTKHQLQAQIDDLRADVKRLELLLSLHTTDFVRHATPGVVLQSYWPVDPHMFDVTCEPSETDPADGWPPSVTVTTTATTREEADPC